MSRLDDVDLTLRLSKKEARSSSRRRRSGWCTCACCSAARSAREELGPPLCVRVRGLGRLGQGRRDQAAGRARSTPGTCGWPSSPPRRTTRSGTTSCWRFWPALPGWGGMAVLDRSWYGRVLVERVEGFATEEQWQRAYDEIVDFETHPRRRGHDPGQVLDARLAGGAAAPVRAAQATTRYKPGSSPTRTGATARSARQYEAAVEEMLERTDHPAAPWYVVAGRGQALGPGRRRPHGVRGDGAGARPTRGIDPDPPLP